MNNLKPMEHIYKNTKISVKFLDTFIISGIVVLILVTVFLAATGGFPVNFETFGGSEVVSQKIKYGQQIKMPPNPTKSGYEFGGWYVDSEGIMPYDFKNDIITQKTTLYAKWVSG